MPDRFPRWNAIVLGAILGLVLIFSRQGGTEATDFKLLPAEGITDIGYTLSNEAPLAIADSVTLFGVQAPHANFSTSFNIFPDGVFIAPGPGQAAFISQDSDGNPQTWVSGEFPPLGSVVGNLSSVAELALAQGSCLSPIPTNFVFMTASTDTTVTVDPKPPGIPNPLEPLAQEDGATGLPLHVTRYPSFNNILFDPDLLHSRKVNLDDTPAVAGTATGGAIDGTTLEDSGAPFGGVNSKQDNAVEIVDGVTGEIFQISTIVSNTSTELTVDPPFDPVLIGGEFYEVTTHIPEVNGPLPPIQPLARYSSRALVSTDDILLQYLIFAPGALEAFKNLPYHPLAQFTDAFGFPSVTILINPTATTSPSGIKDFCSGVGTTTNLLGTALENRFDAVGGVDACVNVPIDDLTNCLNAPPTGAAQGTRYQNPAANSGLLGTDQQVFIQVQTGDRDANDNGIENDLDVCEYLFAGPDGIPGNGDDVATAFQHTVWPTKPLNGWNPRWNNLADWIANDEFGVSRTYALATQQQPYDIDGDGLPNLCDSNNTTFSTDIDLDRFTNRQDNCGGDVPQNLIGQQLFSNQQFESESIGGFPQDGGTQGGGRADSIGDGCDPEPTVANGHYHATLDFSPYCLTTSIDIDGDGWCDNFERLMGVVFTDNNAVDATYSPENVYLDILFGMPRFAAGARPVVPETGADLPSGIHPSTSKPVSGWAVRCNDGVDNDVDVVADSPDADCLISALNRDIGSGDAPPVVTGVTIRDRLDLAFGDDDGDGVPTWHEIYRGTDPYSACPRTTGGLDGLLNPWTPDFNDDDFINITDVFGVLNFWAFSDSSATWSPGADLELDGFINITDIFGVLDVWATSCPFPNPED